MTMKQPADHAERVDAVAAICAALEPTERDRLIYGRTDWRISEWQDHCGDIGCPMCAGSFIPSPAPHLLSAADKALRQHLMQSNQDRGEGV